jgi:hypothetical protein
MEVSSQLHALAALPPGEGAPGIHWIGGWVGPRVILDTVSKRKIPSPCQEFKSKYPIVQPIISHYNDWAISALHCYQILIYSTMSNGIMVSQQICTLVKTINASLNR